ncbi:MAG TPA: phosphoribosyltransferase [Gemmatimonadaceae bacterium]|jgi:predicted phosphoribosyltransferase|nr:phosphoribosyltransferase [Gemmatimonadaceae bacterium]
MWTAFRDRREAGQRLADALLPYAPRDPVVLGLPRGGVPVAFEVARRLDAPLDVCIVRKLGAPGHEEFAMGAIASGGVELLSEHTVRSLGLTREQVAQVIGRERQELARRERAFRDGRPAVDVQGRTVILVDDGLATGASMQAAVMALRSRRPAAIVVAVPVASSTACADIRRIADVCVCLRTPEPFFGVGQWYANFGQTTDDEVRALLAAARSPAPAPAPRPVSPV